MTAIRRLRAETPRRLVLELDATDADALDPTSYVVTRTDGVATAVTVDVAWLARSTVYVLALTEALVPGVEYTLTPDWTAARAVVWRLPLPQTDEEGDPYDPEAEAYGLDVDWLSDALDGERDAPVIRGRECLKHDLIAVALTHHGELVHDPGVGAGAGGYVNQAGAGRRPAELAATWRRLALEDARVAQADVSYTVASTGVARFKLRVTTAPGAALDVEAMSV